MFVEILRVLKSQGKLAGYLALAFHCISVPFKVYNSASETCSSVSLVLTYPVNASFTYWQEAMLEVIVLFNVL